MNPFAFVVGWDDRLAGFKALCAMPVPALCLGVILSLGGGCASSKAQEQEQEEDPFLVLGPAKGKGQGQGHGEGQEIPEKNTEPPPVLADPRFGFSWTLHGGWIAADARQAMPALRTFDGGAALAVRQLRDGQSLILVVPAIGAGGPPVQSNPQNLALLEAQVREKAKAMKLAVQDIGKVQQSGYEAVSLIGREGGRDSAHVHLTILHAEHRRFELQCRRNASAPSACNGVFDDLTITPMP